MKDVTDLMRSYQECARGVWNNCLRPTADFDAVDAFQAVCEILFRETVLRSIGKRDHRRSSSEEVLAFLSLEPVSDTIPIMVNRPTSDGNKYWDDPVTTLPREGSKLVFIDHFDWDQVGFITLQYYRVRIAAFADHPDLVGREALVEVQHCRVLAEVE